MNSDYIKWLKQKSMKHKGDWLTWEVVKEYRKRAEACKKASGEITGTMRQLTLELMQKYDVSEVEAVNILNGYNVGNYVDKYTAMKNINSIAAD